MVIVGICKILLIAVIASVIMLGAVVIMLGLAEGFTKTDTTDEDKHHINKIVL